MGPFRWRLGRIAWARGDYAEIRGSAAWRRLVWRLWYRPQRV